MWRAFIFITFMASGATLGGCAADSHAPLPEFMRVQASDATPPEPPPDVKQMMHEKLDSVFVPTSYPQHVEVSPPHHDVRGPGWIACVRADVTSATGKPLGVQTYRITISDGVISDRLRVGAEDNCVSEKYQPL